MRVVCAIVVGRSSLSFYVMQDYPMVQSQTMAFSIVIDGQGERVDGIKVPRNYLMDSIKSGHLKRKTFKLEVLMAMWNSKLDTLMVCPWTALLLSLEKLVQKL